MLALQTRLKFEKKKETQKPDSNPSYFKVTLTEQGIVAALDLNAVGPLGIRGVRWPAAPDIRP